MSESEPTWILLVRDVSSAARVANQPRTMASLILDADTGLIRGASIAATAEEACARAAQTALTQQAGPLPPRLPLNVVYRDGDLAAEALAALGDVLPSPDATTFLAGPEIPEAEDIFDSLVGHLAGRPQPTDAPDPTDWHDVYAEAAAYCRAEPWQLWSDADMLDLEVTVDDSELRYLAVVLGQEGIQRGLALYPGDALPDDLPGWQPGDPAPVPEGSVTLWLDPADELPEEFRAKAARYGWPDDLAFAPLPASVGPEGLSDLERTAARHLAVALAAVVELHERTTRGAASGTESGTASGTVGATGSGTVSGIFEFSDDTVGEFRITKD